MTKLESIPQVSAVTTPFQSHLVSPSGTIALGQVQWSVPAAGVKDSSLNAVTEAMKPVQADGVRVAYNGSVYPGWRTVLSEVPELIGLIIAFGILMITFGAFVAAGMPILGAIIGVITTLMGITAVASVLTIASASTTVALMLGLSCGIDYGLFILSRHRTNLLNGMTPEESVPLAMGTAGSSVVFAALTVIIALCGLTVVGIPFLTVMGLAAAASVTVALAIIFGLSSDYEVFVVSRIKEEYTRNGDARRAVQRGTALSARVVTAAALIMFSIFVAFMFTSDPTIKAIGFSFAAGVFLDAFVVRLTLVPAVMAIIGSRIWYHPRWFARHVPDPDIEGRRLEHRLVEGELEPAGASAREG